MSSSVRQGEFYPVWPILDGKPIQYQWGEIRRQQAETKAIVRSSFQDIEDGVDTLNSLRAYIGQAFGEQGFDNKYRFIYKKTTEEFCAQRNEGTEAVPSWTDVWCIRFSDGQFQVTSEGGIQSNAGFYGPLAHDMDIIGEHGTGAGTDFIKPNKLYFNVEHGFYLTSDSESNPVVNMAFPFGRSKTFNRTGREWSIEHNYGVSPVMVQVMNDDDRVVIPDQIDVSNPNIAYFYFHEVTSGKALIATGGTGAVELRPKDPFYLVVRHHNDSAEGNVLTPNAELIFDATWFYVNTEPAAQNPKAFVSLTAGAVAYQDHGNLAGLADDDHPQYAFTDGTRDITGHQRFDDSINVENAVTAEAFYLAAGSGGEISKSGNNILISSSAGDVIIDDNLQVTGTGFVMGDLQVGDGSAAVHTINVEGGSTAGNDAVLSLNSSGSPNWSIKNDVAFAGENYLVIRDELNNRSFITVQPGTNMPTLFFSHNSGNLQLDGSLLAQDDVLVSGKTTSEAFYVADGGELGTEGLKTTAGSFSGGVAVAEHASFGDTINVENAVTAEAFYILSGGEITSVSSLRMREIDGTPNVASVSDIIVSNGTLTDNGSGVVTLTTGGGGGAGIDIHDENNSYTAPSDLTFANSWFYLTSDTGGSPVVNLQPDAANTDHGALTGLADDDHTQYVLADGTRNITGTQTLDNANITGTGTIATADINGGTINDVTVNDMLFEDTTTWRNAADANIFLKINPGTSVKKQAGIQFFDRGTQTWQIDNGFSTDTHFFITEAVSGKTALRASQGLLQNNYIDITPEAVKLGNIKAMPQLVSLTTAERDAITPANGMVAYNETTNAFNSYENGAWVSSADYALTDGTRPFSAHVRMDDSLNVENVVTAEAFYLVGGGEWGNNDLRTTTLKIAGQATINSMTCSAATFFGVVNHRNFVDSALTIGIDTGSTSKQDSSITLRDRGNDVWGVRTPVSINDFQVHDSVNDRAPFSIKQGATDDSLHIQTTSVDVGVHANFADSVNVANIVTAEAFYLTTGGEIGGGGGGDFLALDGSTAMTGDIITKVSTSNTDSCLYIDGKTQSNETGLSLRNNIISFVTAGSAHSYISGNTYLASKIKFTGTPSATTVHLSHNDDSNTGISFGTLSGTWSQALHFMIGGKEKLYLDKEGTHGSGFYLTEGAEGVGHSLNEIDIPFHIDAVPAGGDNYYIHSFASQGYIVENVEIITSSGTATASFYIHQDGQGGDGVGVTGLDPISVSSTKTSAASTSGNRVMNHGDSLVMSIPATSSAVHLRGRVRCKLSG